MGKLHAVVRTIPAEIDECGILRRPSWGGILVILLILPLTQRLSPLIERQVMYQTALSHIQFLCASFYRRCDGLHDAPSLCPLVDDAETIPLVRLRISWYPFVHESLDVGLGGGNLYLTENRDLAALEHALEKALIVNSPGYFHISPSMAIATVRFA